MFSASSSFLTRLELLHVAPPICLPVDLSARGVYSGCYRRTFDAVMDDQLRLVIAGSPSADETKKALGGLSAVMVLRDDSGRVLSEHAVGAPDFHEWIAYQKTGLVLTLPMDETKHRAGTYDLSIEVKTPANGMAGHPHCIVAELGLCNVEGIGVYFFAIPVAWIALRLDCIIARNRHIGCQAEKTKRRNGKGA